MPKKTKPKAITKAQDHIVALIDTVSQMTPGQIKKQSSEILADLALRAGRLSGEIDVYFAPKEPPPHAEKTPE